jgi:hypothetical protein
MANNSIPGNDHNSRIYKAKSDAELLSSPSPARQADEEGMESRHQGVTGTRRAEKKRIEEGGRGDAPVYFLGFY